MNSRDTIKKQLQKERKEEIKKETQELKKEQK